MMDGILRCNAKLSEKSPIQEEFCLHLQDRLRTEANKSSVFKLEDKDKTPSQLERDMWPKLWLSQVAISIKTKLHGGFHS